MYPDRVSTRLPEGLLQDLHHLLPPDHLDHPCTGHVGAPARGGGQNI